MFGFVLVLVFVILRVFALGLVLIAVHIIVAAEDLAPKDQA